MGDLQNNVGLILESFVFFTLIIYFNVGAKLNITIVNQFSKNDATKGLFAGLSAHFIWGFLILYWQLLANLSSIDLLAQRMLWAFVSSFILILLTKRFDEVKAAAKNKKLILLLFTSSIILSFNWGLFLWAINSNHVVDASLGYFITPLLNILTGRFFFKELLSSSQKFAIFLAFIGLAGGVILYGHFPWLGIALACSFATYGYIKKSANIDAAPALFIECGFASIFALIWILSTSPSDFAGLIGHGSTQTFLIMFCGVLTAVPLLSFSYATRHLTLTTIGILQYLSPSINFILAVTIMGENIKSADYFIFPLVWSALLIYTWDAVRTMRNVKKVSKIS